MRTFMLRCIECKKSFLYKLEEEDLARWRAGEHIQNIWPEMDRGHRELMISRVCGDCFDKMFPPEPEDLIPEWKESMTMGEQLNPAVAIFRADDKEQALRYVKEYAAWMFAQTHLTEEGAMETAAENIRYWAGYLDHEEAVAMRRFYFADESKPA